MSLIEKIESELVASQWYFSMLTLDPRSLITNAGARTVAIAETSWGAYKTAKTIAKEPEDAKITRRTA